MRFRRERHTHGLEFNMTSMVDVVCLLIVFFMAVQEFSRLELADVALPGADQAAVLPQVPQRLVINVLADGRLLVANEEMDLALVTDLMRREQDRLRAGGGAANLALVVRADGAAPAESVQRLMRAAASLGIWRLDFAATPEEP